MRQDFRVKLDFSKIYQDARQNSWVYVDGAKIHYVHQLADHIQKLFDVQRPFHLLARYEEAYFFLPFEEDVRVLESNDTVQIIPGTGILDNTESSFKKGHSKLANGYHHQQLQQQLQPQQKEEQQQQQQMIQQQYQAVQQQHQAVQQQREQYEFRQPKKPKDDDFDKSSSALDIMEYDTTTDLTSANNTFYKTCPANDSKDSKILKDNITQDDSELLENGTEDNSNATSKKKRIRKRKQKKHAELSESESSYSETVTDKKPKIIHSVMIPPKKHIRFEDHDENNTDYKTDQNQHVMYYNSQPVHISQEKINSGDFTALLNLRKSSTPMTFAHKKVKKNQNIEVKEEEQNNTISRISDVLKSNDTIGNNDTVSFKMLKMSEDYNPQMSSPIVAKVLEKNGSQYTFKIIDGKDQLKQPEGKFSLPVEDGEDNNEEENDVVTLDASCLHELSKVKYVLA